MAKKIMSAFIAVMLVICASAIPAFAADGPSAYVSISDKDGKLVLVLEKIDLSDADGDGTITINDALYLAHEAEFEGGAAAGYASEQSDYGLSLTKLWGCENGGSYGYYVNDASAMSLADPVKDGDRINAFVYTDLKTWSDKYCYFDKASVTAQSGESFSLVLTGAGFDGDWNPVSVPVEGAKITVDGEATDFVTGADGRVSVTVSEAGSHVISAISDSETLVPPVCVAVIEAVSESESETAADTAAETKTDTDKNAAEPDKEQSAQTSDMSAAVAVCAFAAVAVCVMLNVKRRRADR